MPAEKRKQLDIGISQEQYEMIKTAAEQVGGFGLREGGVRRERGSNHWQESRDSHLTHPWFYPNNRVNLSWCLKYLGILQSTSLKREVC